MKWHILYRKKHIYFPVRELASVSRYDSIQLALNSVCGGPICPRKISSTVECGNQRMTRALFDGHAGWQTADLLKKQHLPFVRHSLSHAKLSGGEESVSNELVQNDIVKGFVSLEDSITSQSTETL